MPGKPKTLEKTTFMPEPLQEEHHARTPPRRATSRVKSFGVLFRARRYNFRPEQIHCFWQGKRPWATRGILGTEGFAPGESCSSRANLDRG
eukprot:939978-Amphidinium_carterae.1